MHKLAGVPGKRDVATRRELNDASVDATVAAVEGAATVAPDLTSVAQDYLKVIWTAREWSQEEKVTTKLLAERIGVSASTVSEAVRKLADQGLVEHARYGSITLTAHGSRAAVAMVRRHRLLETFLVNELGYGWDEVHDEAEVLEHAVSDRLLDAMDARLGHPTADPHGDPIPQPDGTVPHRSGVLASALGAGERGLVVRISDRDPAVLRLLDDAGVGIGSSVVGGELPADAAAAVWVAPV